MSMLAQARISAQASQLGHALNGNVSLYAPRGSTAVTPTFTDQTVSIAPANGNTSPAFGSKVVFNLPKNSTLISQCWIRSTLSPGQTNPAYTPPLNGAAEVGTPQAEYVKNLGDFLYQNHSVQYGNSQLQNFDGAFVALFRRLIRNDVNIEGTNAMILGNLPPSTSVTGPEQVLVDAFYNGVTVYTPLEELFFAKNLDEAWMTEAYALEGQIISQLADLSSIVVTKTRSNSVLAVLPALSNVNLVYIEITLSAAEKDNRLKHYRTPEGLVNTWMDLEYQKGVVLTSSYARPGGAPGPVLALSPLVTRVIQLNNLRMDMAELVFCIRRLTNSNAATVYPDENGTLQPWSGSPMEGSNGLNGSRLSPINGVANTGFATLIDIQSFALKAGQKLLYAETIDSFWNRAQMRKSYHKDAQIVGAIYCIPFARFPEDCKNATGFLSASTLGVLTLEVTYRDPGNNITYQFDLWDRCYNLMQSRGGGIVAALK